MRVFQNNFSRLHLVVFLVIWACFTGWTYWIAEHGIDQYDHTRLTVLHHMLGQFFSSHSWADWAE